MRPDSAHRSKGKIPHEDIIHDADRQDTERKEISEEAERKKSRTELTLVCGDPGENVGKDAVRGHGWCLDPGSNWGPFALQANALTN